MYDEIIKELALQLSEQELSFLRAANLHLAIFTEPYLSYLLNGEKTI